MFVAALRGLSDQLIEDMQAGGPSHANIDPDTSLNSHTWEAALLAALASVRFATAFVLLLLILLVRPRGLLNGKVL